MNTRVCTGSAAETACNVHWRFVEQVLPHGDTMLHDHRMTIPERHKKWVGVDNKLTLENFKKAYETFPNIDFIARTPLIPGINADEEHIRAVLRLDSPGMSAPGLAPPADGEKKYRLGPFLVGWYEANMRLLDGEFANFSSNMSPKAGERIFSPRPRVLGVVPVRGSVTPELLEPHHDIDAHSRYTGFS
jgi:hypothetical protein